MDSSHVVSGVELARLYRRARLWWVGWLLMILALFGVVYFVAKVQAMRDLLVEIRLVQADQREIQTAQTRDTAAIVEAWEQVQQEAVAIQNIGDYLKARRLIIDSNRGLVIKKK